LIEKGKAAREMESFEIILLSCVRRRNQKYFFLSKVKMGRKTNQEVETEEGEKKTQKYWIREGR
jgi:hypothetical protein